MENKKRFQKIKQSLVPEKQSITFLIFCVIPPNSNYNWSACRLTYFSQKGHAKTKTDKKNMK